MQYQTGYKYQLYTDELFQTPFRPDKLIKTRFILLSYDGMMSILSGYAWDGASGPTWDTKNTMRGSLFHDAAYQLIRLGLLKEHSVRQIADEYFGVLLKEDGMGTIRRKLWIRAVKRFAASAADPKNRRCILTAP